MEDAQVIWIRLRNSHWGPSISKYPSASPMRLRKVLGTRCEKCNLFTRLRVLLKMIVRITFDVAIVQQPPRPRRVFMLKGSVRLGLLRAVQEDAAESELLVVGDI